MTEGFQTEGYKITLCFWFVSFFKFLKEQNYEEKI